MRLVNRWMNNHGLSLATEKTELVLVTRKLIPTTIPMQVDSETIEAKGALKHLGIMLDTKLTFWEQIRRAADKAATVTTALSRLIGQHQRTKTKQMAFADDGRSVNSPIWK